LGHFAPYSVAKVWAALTAAALSSAAGSMLTAAVITALVVAAPLVLLTGHHPGSLGPGDRLVRLAHSLWKGRTSTLPWHALEA
jgi:hypothetical protein